MAYILGIRSCEFKKNPRSRFRFITFFVKKTRKNRLLAIFGKISRKSKNEKMLHRDLVKIHLCAKFEPSNPNTLAAMSSKDLSQERFYNMLSSRTSDLRWLMQRLHCAPRNEAAGVLGCAHALRACRAARSARLAQNPPPILISFPDNPYVTFPNTPSSFMYIFTPNLFARATFRPIAFFNSILLFSCLSSIAPLQ